MRRSRPLLVVLALSQTLAGCVPTGYEHLGGNFPPYDYAACNGWMWVIARPPKEDQSALLKLAEANPSSRHLESYASEIWYRAPDGAVMLCRSDTLPHRACLYEFWEFQKVETSWKITNSGDWDCKTDEVQVTS